MSTCSHPGLQVITPAAPGTLAYYLASAAALKSISEAASGRACCHSERLSAPGWYIIFTRDGLRTVVTKVGQSRRVFARVRGQLSGFDPEASVLIAVTAPDCRIDDALLKQVEWTVGCTLARAAAHGLLGVTYKEPFEHDRDDALDTGIAETLAAEVLSGGAGALGCGAWQLLDLRQRSARLWPEHLLPGANRKTLRQLRRMFDAGALRPGDRFEVMGGPQTVTFTSRLLCRIGSSDHEYTPRGAIDAILAQGPYSPNTRRNAWDALVLASGDDRDGMSLNDLLADVPDRLECLTARCHLAR